MKGISCLLTVASVAVFAPGVWATPVERYSESVGSEPVCFMEVDGGRVVDLTALCGTGNSAQDSNTPLTPEEADIQADLLKVQLEAATRRNQSNAELMNQAIQSGLNMGR